MPPLLFDNLLAYDFNIIVIIIVVNKSSPMQKFLLYTSLMLVTIVSATSCTKNFDCECTDVKTGEKTTTPITTNTRALASTTCKSQSISGEYDCKLK